MAMRQLKITNSITTRECPSLDKYLLEIGKQPLLTADEEVELAIRIREGDKKALDRLTRANLRFVVSVAKQYQGRGVSLSDMINEGNIGLIKAAERYDERKGFKFISFAVWWIRQHIMEAIAKHSRLIRLPIHRVALGGMVMRKHSELEQELERYPTEEELAEALSMQLDLVNLSLAYRISHVSLDSPVGNDDEDSNLMDIMINHSADKPELSLMHGESLKKDVLRSLSVLNHRQKEAICYYFGIGHDQALTLEAIASKMDLTPERVRQIKDKALLILRNKCNTDVLRAYLGA